MKGLMYLPFVALTFLCWGLYGPVLHQGQGAFALWEGKSAFRPFICVGIAYFVIAAAVPGFILKWKGEGGNWTLSGFLWSFIAGGIGALGALGIILAFKWGGTPIYVMPLVFGCAPVVNTFVTMMFSRTFNQASLTFFLGILVVAIGGVGVLVFKPVADKPHAQHSKTQPISNPTQTETTPVALENQATPVVFGKSDQTTAQKEDSNSAKSVENDHPPTRRQTIADMVLRTLCIIATALCWGAYGPVLHKGQALMNGSRLRPFICVGLAYFAIAVVIPFLIMPAFNPEIGTWYTFSGFAWSLGAGALGAIGALGIIYAFNFGGKPLIVMPLVFGCAPVINTFTEAISKGTWQNISYLYLLSLFLVIAGAVTVLTNAPKPGPPKKAAQTEPKTAEA